MQAFVRKLRKKRYANGQYTHHAESFITTEFDEVAKGDDYDGRCVRMASAFFVSTAYHFLKVFFNGHQIPGFDVTRLERIS
jgi:hypothetical protein